MTRSSIGSLAAALLVATCATAGAAEDATSLLQQADSIKSANHAEFVAILNSLDTRAARLSGAQKEYLRYLKGWNATVEGDDETATLLLQQSIQQSHDVTLQFRARSTLMNLHELTRHYDEA